MEAIKTFSDMDLVLNLRSGSLMDETIRSLYTNYFDGLSFYVQNNSGTRQDAEDIFQEVVVTFIELVQKDKFRGESTVKTFLFSLTRHMWLNELKRRNRAMAREGKYEKAKEHTQQDIAHVIAEREAKRELIDLVSRLGETCRKILVMFYYENRSTKEMLKAFDYENEQVIRNKKYKCMKQLEEMITVDPALKLKLKNLLNG